MVLFQTGSQLSFASHVIASVNVLCKAASNLVIGTVRYLHLHVLRCWAGMQDAQMEKMLFFCNRARNCCWVLNETKCLESTK
jgi:hypothetical protein